ncbi:hypothetical protein RCL1_002134 [Eukaryota sp. TZLM3-RCL]
MCIFVMVLCVVMQSNRGGVKTYFFFSNSSSIETTNIKPRNLSPTRLKTANKIFDELIEMGFARPSTSPYSAPIVLVEKEGKEARLTGDYSELNKVTQVLPADIPHLSELPKFLSNKNFIAVFDFPRAFWQIKVKEDDIPKTAISIGKLNFVELLLE